MMSSPMCQPSYFIAVGAHSMMIEAFVKSAPVPASVHVAESTSPRATILFAAVLVSVSVRSTSAVTATVFVVSDVSAVVPEASVFSFVIVSVP